MVRIPSVCSFNDVREEGRIKMRFDDIEGTIPFQNGRPSLKAMEANLSFKHNFFRSKETKFFIGWTWKITYHILRCLWDVQAPSTKKYTIENGYHITREPQYPRRTKLWRTILRLIQSAITLTRVNPIPHILRHHATWQNPPQMPPQTRQQQPQPWYIYREQTWKRFIINSGMRVKIR